MKRCPQCEFIYEDDQSLCDMDGVLLVFDSRTLPNIHALATVEAPMASKAQLRNRAVPAMATLVLMIVLGLVYFVSTRTAHSPAPASVTDTPVTAPTANPVVTEQPADTNQTPPPPAAEASDAAVTTKEEPKTETTKAAATAPAKKSTVKTTNTQTKPAEETKKDDSKVGSILKKTGRILKKPFKF